MTVEVPYVPTRLSGDGFVTAFAFGHISPTTGDTKVTLVDANNLGTPQTEGGGADYTIVLDADGIGGTVNMVVPPSNTEQLLMELELADTQITDIPNVGGLQEEQIEVPLDRRTLVSQLQLDAQARSFKVTTLDATNQTIVTDMPTPVDGRALLWVTSGSAIRLSNTSTNFSDLDAVVAVTSANAIITTADAVSTAADVVSADASATAAAASATSAAAAAATVVSPLRSIKNVEWLTTSITQVKLEAGASFISVQGGSFTFATSQVFDITTSGIGGLIDEVEATSTIYVLIAIGDNSDTNPPEICAVNETAYQTFEVADLPSGYTDYKRIPGSLLNNGSDALEGAHYKDGEVFVKDDTAFVGSSTTSATFVDVDISAFLPAFIRTVNATFFNTSATTANWRTKDVAGTGMPISNASVILYKSFPVRLNALGIFEIKTSAGSISTRITSYKDDGSEEGNG